jgi:cation diffusion facilitator CzcD-associated flavoprotein CzcO
MMDFRESFYDAVIDGSHPFANELRRQSKEMMQTQLADRPDLWEKLTPKYNPGCKRVIISDDYYPTLALPNVALETRPIHRIGSNSVSVVGEDGQPDVVEADFDLLVCATGFQTTEFMHPGMIPKEKCPFIVEFMLTFVTVCLGPPPFDPSFLALTSLRIRSTTNQN